MSAVEDRPFSITDGMLDSVLEVRASMFRTGHNSVTVDAPAEWDEHQAGLYVTGYKSAALDRCAFVAADGQVTWLR